MYGENVTVVTKAGPITVWVWCTPDTPEAENLAKWLNTRPAPERHNDLREAIARLFAEPTWAALMLKSRVQHLDLMAKYPQLAFKVATLALDDLAALAEQAAPVKEGVK